MTALTAVAAIQGWCPWCGNHMGWGGWTMMIGWVLILVVLVVAVWAVADGRWSGRGQGTGRTGEDRAESVLRERFARGEIDEEEYRRKLDELRRG